MNFNKSFKIFSIFKESKAISFLKFLKVKQITLLASNLAFQSVMVLVPLFVLTFWYFKIIGGTEEWMSQVQTFALSHLNVNSGEQLNLYVKNILRSAYTKNWSILSFLVFLYSVISLLYRLGDFFDNILYEEGEIVLNWKKSVLMVLKRFLILFFVSLFLAVSFYVKTWMIKNSFLPKGIFFPILHEKLAISLSYIIDIFGLFIVYQFYPTKRVRWNSSLKASIIVAFTLGIGRWAISTYGSYAFTAHRLYGAAAAFILFLLWLQLVWIIFLSGLHFLDTKKDKKF